MQFSRIRPLYFILGWTVANILQAACTELTSDEGYYWFYSTSPAWGYYDHPPFLAWIVRLGYEVFPNELGVRILNVLLNSASLALFFSWLPPESRQKAPVFVLLLAAPLVSYLAFIIFPDGPLLFFSMVFLSFYRKFLERKSWGLAIAIGVASACMLYSKYHGILVIGFVLLSNPRLLLSGYFHVAALVCLALFAPHVYWQWENGYPSIAYHLSGRVSPISTRHVLEYVSQQLVAIGPALIFIPFVCRQRSLFEKALLFIIGGSFIFFFLASFKAFVHFHWTSIAVFPLLYFATRFYGETKRRTLLWSLTLPFVFLLLIFRLQLMVPVFPVTHLNVDYYHGRKAWAEELSAIAGTRPVVFAGDFREPALYSFYANKPAVAIFSAERRKSQYDTWRYDDSVQHRSVLLIQYSAFPGSREWNFLPGKTHYLRDIPEFVSFYNLPAHAENVKRTAKNGLSADLIIRNGSSRSLSFPKDGDGNYPVLIYRVMYRGETNFRDADTIRVLGEIDQIPPMASRRFPVTITAGAGSPAQVAIAIQYGILPDYYACFIKW